VTETPLTDIRIGISSCLLGQEVRYDGGHKRDTFITGTLSRYFEFVPVCPELAIGLGVPREPIQLVGTPEDIRVVGTRNPALDVTEKLRAYGRSTAARLGDLGGYIFKARSPSCGMERVKLRPAHGGMASHRGVGQYAQAFIEAAPLLPAEEEGRLNDPVLRENFLERVFVYRRWRALESAGVSARGLVEFHTRHKLTVMAHGVAAYRELGRLVAAADRRRAAAAARDYVARLMPILRKPATRRGHANVLHHLQGYLKRKLDAADKAELRDVIEQYRSGRLPLVVPVTLLRHHFRRHPDPYVEQQVYLNPYPAELMLRNLV
jgi:uncharacterized protein YbgA (DUF1722 family)/uncharacterized protein YbbK (DUF523 family)